MLRRHVNVSRLLALAVAASHQTSGLLAPAWHQTVHVLPQPPTEVLVVFL